MIEHQGQKLKDFLDNYKKPGEKRKSKDAIAEELGIARGTLYNYFDKEVLDLDFIKLLNEKGYEFELDKLSILVKPEKEGPGNIIYVPLIAYGGFLHGYADKKYLNDLERFSMPGIRGEHFAFEVQGNSMAPYANPGDVVIARKEERLEWMVRGRAYVLQTVDGILVKLFDKILDGKACFKSADKDGSSPIIPLKNIKGIYQVVKVLKDFMATH